MASQIVIDPVTRIEGHAKITIELDDARRGRRRAFPRHAVPRLRALVQGRPVHEMPSLMARICGICPVSHLIASSKACDEILAVEPPPTGADLRRLMNLAQIVQSHALSFFHLSSPDLLLGFDADPAQRNIFGVAREQPAAGARRHRPAPVRPADHRAARRQADPPVLGRARRRRASR